MQVYLGKNIDLVYQLYYLTIFIGTIRLKMLYVCSPTEREYLFTIMSYLMM